MKSNFIVRSHPSGRLTLTKGVDGHGLPSDCGGPLFANLDAVEFYRHVALSLAKAHQDGEAFTYRDALQDDNSTSRDEEIDVLLHDVVPEVAFSTFDSHHVIHRIMHCRQRRYVALLGSSASETPFQDVHGRIGKRLKAMAAELGLSEGVASASPDLFGNVQSCVSYTRLV